MTDWNDLIVGTCDWGDCGRWADSLRFDERLGCLIPVCWRDVPAHAGVSPRRPAKCWRG